MRFTRVIDGITRALGSPRALVGAFLLIGLWGLTGPVFGFSDTWQLLINTTTTVITFCMVFVIQHTANREALATRLKLDELIRAVADARNEFIDLDRASDQFLAERELEMERIAEEGERATRRPHPHASRRPTVAARRG